MEDALELYVHPYNEKEPLVGLDEGSTQLLSEKEEAMRFFQKLEIHYTIVSSH